MNQTQSVNFSTNHKLVNFNVPNHLINKFDNLVKFKRVSRTSMLVRLMETFLRYELTQMEKDNKKIEDMITQINQTNHKSKHNWSKREQYEPPMIPLTSDDVDDFMGENFWKDRLG